MKIRGTTIFTFYLIVNPVWTPVGTNILTGDSSDFSDPEWSNHPARFYRLRSP